MFYDKFVELCVQNNIAPTNAAIAAGLTAGSVTGWKKGSPPRSSAVRKIANYFNVPIEYFDGEPIAGVKKDPSQMAEVEVDSELAEMWKSADANERKAIIDAAKLIMGLRGKK